MEINDGPVEKLGLIVYLWDQWDPSPVDYSNIAQACGEANAVFDLTRDGIREWEDVLQRIGRLLGIEIKESSPRL